MSPNRSPIAATVALLAVTTAGAAKPEFDYHRPTAQLVERGTQALMICNGLFVSHRTLEQIYEQELELNRMSVLPPSMVAIDEKRGTVAVGAAANDPVPTMRAALRPGLGCVVLAPNQTFADLDQLPALEMPPPAGDPETTPWPDGDLVTATEPPAEIDQAALEAAWDWAFDRERYGHPSQITLSLLIVYRDQIVLERYAPGVDRTTRTRTWSTAKSIASTLIGIAVAEGELALDESLPFDDWGPVTGPDDPRRRITLRHVLHMSSGLDPVDDDRCSVIGSCLSYFAGTSSVAGATGRGAVHAPGIYWNYENYDTLLAVHALETAIGDPQAYLERPRRALLDRIGMRSTVPGVDRFGHFVMSSQVYTNARDLARLGLLYLHGGKWHDEQVLPSEWVEFVRTPAPATAERGNFYGGQWWLVPDQRTDVPHDAYTTAGNRGQYAIVVPSYDLIVVRRGLDWMPRPHGFPEWDLLREVLKAFPQRPWGEKPAATPSE